MKITLRVQWIFYDALKAYKSFSWIWIWGSSSQQNLFTLKGIETEEKTRFSKNRWFPGKSHPPEKGTLPSTWGRGYYAKSQEEMCEINHRPPNILNIKPPFTIFVQKKNSPNFPNYSPNHQICLQKRNCWVNIEVSTPLGKLMPCCFCSGFEETNVSLAIVFPNPWQSLQMASIMTHFQHLRELCSEDPSRTGDLLH